MAPVAWRSFASYRSRTAGHAVRQPSETGGQLHPSSLPPQFPTGRESEPSAKVSRLAFPTRTSGPSNRATRDSVPAAAARITCRWLAPATRSAEAPAPPARPVPAAPANRRCPDRTSAAVTRCRGMTPQRAPDARPSAAVPMCAHWRSGPRAKLPIAKPLPLAGPVARFPSRGRGAVQAQSRRRRRRRLPSPLPSRHRWAARREWQVPSLPHRAGR
jgi:hypothetical protein